MGQYFNHPCSGLAIMGQRCSTLDVICFKVSVLHLACSLAHELAHRII